MAACWEDRGASKNVHSFWGDLWMTRSQSLRDSSGEISGSYSFFWPIGAGRLAKCGDLTRWQLQKKMFNYLLFKYFLDLLITGTAPAQMR